MLHPAQEIVKANDLFFGSVHLLHALTNMWVISQGNESCPIGE